MLEDVFDFDYSSTNIDMSYPSVYISELDTSALVKVRVLRKINIHYGSRYVFFRYYDNKIVGDTESNIVIYGKTIPENTLLYAHDMGDYWLLPIKSDLGNCHLYVDSILMELT